MPDRRPTATTLGELRASGHHHRPVKTEVRENLLDLLRSGRPRFEGIVGFDETVLPALERALLAGHDVVLLGERGQGKTRLIRTLVTLLDEWTPVVDGCEINDHPEAPVCARCRRLHGELGDDLPVGWQHRSERYGEKLATPDTCVGDLIGDIDPVKVAEGRTLGDPETVHFGLVPRTNRGIFAINELPDLAERIQVSLLNVLEERDIQVRGYALRLPLDVLLVASANPEDYTNRGRIITPLKDRFGAEIRTHYPDLLEDEIAVIRQEADLAAIVPDFLLEVVARFTRHVRESPAVDARSGVSARFGIAAAETAAASALRRAALTGEHPAVARVCDLPAAVPTLLGKVEFEVDEEGREIEVLAHLLRKATVETFRQHLGASDLQGADRALRRGPGRRERRPGAGPPAARAGRPVPGPGARAGPARRRRGRRDPGAGRGRAGVRPGGAVPQPPDQQGRRARIRRQRSRVYRRSLSSDPRGPRMSPRGTATAAGTTGRTRSRRRTTSAGPWTASATTCSPARRRGTPCGACCAAAPATGRAASTRCCAGSASSGARLRERGRLDGTPRGGPPAARHGRRAGARRAVPRPVRRRAVPRGDPRRAAAATRPARCASSTRYDWRSPEAAATFEQIKDLLRREVLDTQFRGMKQALENPDPAAMQRVKDMMADLNAMLDADARGEHTQEQFDEFMAEVRRHVPGRSRRTSRSSSTRWPAGPQRPSG